MATEPMTRLDELKAEHPEWCFYCGSTSGIGHGPSGTGTLCCDKPMLLALRSALKEADAERDSLHADLQSALRLSEDRVRELQDDLNRLSALRDTERLQLEARLAEANKPLEERMKRVMPPPLVLTRDQSVNLLESKLSESEAARRELEDRLDHARNGLPGCMMPDGADPCDAYQKLRALAAHCLELRKALEAMVEWSEWTERMNAEEGGLGQSRLKPLFVAKVAREKAQAVLSASPSDIQRSAEDLIRREDRERILVLERALHKAALQWCRGIHPKDKPCEVCQGAKERVFAIYKAAIPEERLAAILAPQEGTSLQQVETEREK